jgi:uncharacterized protein DUF1707
VPGLAPGAGPRPLAAEADRDRLVALLREHYAVGLFGLDELDRRVGMVLSAQYLDEAAAAVADLPGVPAQPALRHRRALGHRRAAPGQAAARPRPRGPARRRLDPH